MRSLLTFFCLLTGLAALSQPSGDEPGFAAGHKGPGVYRENGQVGLQNSRHKPITPPVYDTLYRVNSALFAGQRYQASRQESLWGIINNDGERLIPFAYKILQISHSYAVVGLQERNLIRYGVYNFNGKEIIPAQYDTVKVLNARYVSAVQEDKTIIVNDQGVKIMAIKADDISLLANDLVLFSRYQKKGLSRLNGESIVPAAYRDLKLENDDILIKQFPEWQVVAGYDTLTLHYDHLQSWDEIFIATIAGKSWLLNHRDEAISAQYDTIIIANEKLALVKSKSKWGVISYSGKEIIPLAYTQIALDSENIRVRTNSNHAQWFLFDFYGFQKTKLGYDSIRAIAEGRIAVRRNKYWGYLDRYGVEILPPVYDQAGQFKQGMSVVTLHGEDGIINRHGKWLVLPSPLKIIEVGDKVILGKIANQFQIRKFDGELVYFTGNRLEKFDNGFYERDSAGVVIRKISRTGTFIFDYPEGEVTRAGGAGLTIFKANNRYGFKDQQGRIVIANRYEEVKSFNQRMAAIKINNHWGFINLDEQIIIQPLYDSVGFFNNGTCIVSRQALQGVVNLQGKVVIPPEYDSIVRLTNGNFRVKKQGQWGVLSNNGEVIIHPKYDQLIPVNQGFYIVARNGKYGTLDLTGVNKIPLLYSYIAYDEQSKTLVTKRADKNKWAFLKKAHSFSN